MLNKQENNGCSLPLIWLNLKAKTKNNNITRNLKKTVVVFV